MRTTEGSPPAELKLIADPETRRRVAMAAESDLEALPLRATGAARVDASTTSPRSWFHMSGPEPARRRCGREFKELVPRRCSTPSPSRARAIITAVASAAHIRVAAALTDIGHAAARAGGRARGRRSRARRRRRIARAARRAAGGRRPRATATATRAPSATAGARAATREHEVSCWRAPAPRRPGSFDPRARRQLGDPHRADASATPRTGTAKEILFQCLHLHYKALEFLTAAAAQDLPADDLRRDRRTLLGTLDHAPARPRQRQHPRPRRSAPTRARSRPLRARARRRPQATTSGRPSGRRSSSTWSAW